MTRSVLINTGCVLFGLMASLAISWGSAMWIERDWENAVANERTGQFLGSWSTQRDIHLNGWNLRVQNRFAAQRASATNGMKIQRQAGLDDELARGRARDHAIDGVVVDTRNAGGLCVGSDREKRDEHE